MSEDRALSMFRQREIEAAFFRDLREPLVQRLGEEGLRQALLEAVSGASCRAGEAAAGSVGNDLEALKEIVGRWTAGGALDIETLEDSPEVLRFSVRRCAYAEAYEEMGIRNWGTALSCERDFAFIKGFNPEITLTRTKTLMEGADCCDFCYRLGNGSDKEPS